VYLIILSINREQYGILSSFVDSIEEFSHANFTDDMKLYEHISPSKSIDRIPVIDIQKLLEIKTTKVLNCEIARIIFLKNLHSNKKRIILVESIDRTILLPNSWKTLSMNSTRKFSKLIKIGTEIFRLLDIEKIFMTESDN
jgi:hypothetical protein